MPKALSSMVAEVDHLKKRIGDLEDAELEVMEQLEQAVAERDRLRGRADELMAAVAEVTARRDEQLAGLDVEVGQRRTKRSEVVPTIEAPLLALYDRVAAAATAESGRRAPGPAVHRLPARGECRGPPRLRRGRRRRGAALRGVQHGSWSGPPTRGSEQCNAEVPWRGNVLRHETSDRGRRVRKVGRPARRASDELAAGARTSGPSWRCRRSSRRTWRAAAEWAASSPRLQDPDRTDIELVTIDPEGSHDLDQALHITRDGSGFVVSYAIADLAAPSSPPATRWIWKPIAA